MERERRKDKKEKRRKEKIDSERGGNVPRSVENKIVKGRRKKRKEEEFLMEM